MKTKNTIKKIAICAGCFALTLGGAIAICNNNNFKNSFASSTSVPVEITNGNFNKSTKSTDIFNPSSFTSYDDVKEISLSNEETNAVKGGVINLGKTDSKYYSSFQNAKTSRPDDYVLMIQSLNSSRTIGFRSNNSIKLDKNSNYLFSVDVYTNSNDQIANVYLLNEDGSVYLSLENKVASNQTWTTEYLLVSTDDIHTLNLKVGVYLEGKGTVLFDNITCQKISDNSASRYTNAVVNNRHLVNSFSANGSILEDKNKNELSFKTIYTGVDDFTSTLPSQINNGRYSNSVLITSSKPTYFKEETENELFVANKNSIYKVVISAKTNISGQVDLSLIKDKVNNEEVDSEISTFSITKNPTADITNDFVDYTFYILTSSKDDVTYKFGVSFGTTNKLTTGDLYISNIDITKVDYASFNDASEGDTIKKINLRENEIVEDDDTYLDNGNFNNLRLTDNINSSFYYTKPSVAVDWTIDAKENQFYGIINTSDDYFDALDLTGKINPYKLQTTSDTKNNNVLMMQNKNPQEKMSYKSNAKTLKSNSYYKFSLDIQAQYSNATLSLVTTKDGKDITLVEKEIVSNPENWSNEQLFIRTGYTDIDVSLKITLDKSSCSYVYIDEAKCETTTDFVFNGSLVKIDLNNIFKGEDNAQFANSLFFNNDNELVNMLIFNTDNKGDIANSENFNTIGLDKDVLAIISNSDVNFTTSSKFGFRFESSKYYKISLKAYTQNLNSDITSDTTKYGAGIKLTGFDDSFKNINTDEQWEEYTFYIHPTSATTSFLELSLGGDNDCSGSLFVADFNIDDTIEESQFNKINNTNNILKISDTEDNDTDTENDTQTNNSAWLANFWYYAPSLIFALAIVIAIVGALLRKVKFKKPTLKKTKVETKYDRSNISKQLASRKATTVRENEIIELTKELENLQQERVEFENKYKQDLNELRKLKLRRGNIDEIMKLEKEMKKNQKLSSTIGVNINKISSQLEYTKTENYLNSLIKKFMNNPRLLNEENKKEEDK